MLTFMIWYLVGLLGCILASYSEIKNGGDFTVTDLILSIIFSTTGPVIAILAICFYLKENPDSIVLIKGKKK